MFLHGGLCASREETRPKKDGRRAPLVEIRTQATHVCHAVRMWSFVTILPWQWLKNLSATTQANATTSREHISRLIRAIGETKRRSLSPDISPNVHNFQQQHFPRTCDGCRWMELQFYETRVMVAVTTRHAGKHSALEWTGHVRYKLSPLIRLKKESLQRPRGNIILLPS